MDRPATGNPATAREIILEIVRNMREGLEPLHYSTLAPAIYNVYLHPDDMERLRGIIPRIVEEASRALDSELESLNRETIAERLKIARRGEPKITPPDGGWRIRILENTDDDARPGDINISSELALPVKQDYGAGSLTKRIATRRTGGAASTSHSYDKPASADKPAGTEKRAEADKPAGAEKPAGTAKPWAPLPDKETILSDFPVPHSPGTAEPAPLAPGALAVIEYDDGTGHKQFQMMKDQIVVGRGGRDYWTDLKLDTLADVSREHFRLRRDPATGHFFLKDLSRLGTTINGEKAPSSIEYVEGEKRDRNVEAPVPDTARIGLANVVFLDFRSAFACKGEGA